MATQEYFCLENPMDRGAWQATVHGVRALIVVCSLNLQQPSDDSVDILAVLPERCSALSASPDYDHDSQISVLEDSHPPSRRPLFPPIYRVFVLWVFCQYLTLIR